MPKSTIAASVMKASGGKPVLIFSSLSDKPASENTYDAIRSAKYAAFSCTACDTKMLARHNSHPFCVTCSAGEESVKRVDSKILTASIKNEANLDALTCSSCNSTTVLPSYVRTAIQAAGAKGEKLPIHCSCCGTAMHPINASDEAAVEEVVDEPVEEGAEDADIQLAELDEIEASEDGELEISEGDLEGLDEMEVEAAGDDWPFVDRGEETTAAKGDDDLPMEDDVKPADAAPVAETAPAETIAPAGDSDISSDDDIALEPFTLEEDVMDPVDNEDLTAPVEASDDFDEDDVAVAAFEDPTEGDALADAMDMDDSDDCLSFVQANGRVVAMKAHVAVASLTKEGAGKNADLMFKPAMTAAALNAVKAYGMRKGLTSVGFKMHLVPVTTKAAVSRELQKMQASAAKKEEEQRKDFAAAFALASAGLSRGSWKGYDNPMLKAVETELNRLGVSNSKRLAASIVSAASVPYSKNLLEVTSKLLKVSAATRAEYAEMFDLTSSTSIEASAEEEDGEEDLEVTSNQVEARFQRAALLRPRVTSSVQSVTSAADILAGKANLQFSSLM
jgi:hypothetical protein